MSRAIAAALVALTAAVLAAAEPPTLTLGNGWVFDGELLGGEKEQFSKADVLLHGDGWQGTCALRREHVAHGFQRTEEGEWLEHQPLPPVAAATRRYADAPAHRPGAAILPFGWRGDGSGRFPDAVAPSSFVPVWSLPMRAWTQSSPCLAAGAVYCLDDPHRLVCIDAADGSIRWQRDHPLERCGHRAARMGYPRNDFVRNTYKYTTPTPVADAEGVYVVFGHGVVVSYDHRGRQRWISSFVTEAKMRSGVSISPVLVGDWLIIGGAGPAAFAAYDRATGQQLWRVGRPGNKRGKGAHLAVHRDGGDFVLGSTCRLLDLQGERVAALPELGNYGPTPCLQGDLVVANTGTGALHCGRLVPGEETAWTWQVPCDDSRSPLIVGDRIFQSHGKDLVAHALADGRELARIATIGKWSSPILAGSSLICVGRSGKGATGLTIQVIDIADGALTERCRIATPISPAQGPWDSGSSPVCDGNRLYLRGAEALWCLAAGE